MKKTCEYSTEPLGKSSLCSLCRPLSDHWYHLVETCCDLCLCINWAPVMSSSPSQCISQIKSPCQLEGDLHEGP